MLDEVSCIVSRSAKNGDSCFCSKLEKLLYYCHYRTVKLFRPTTKDTLAYWLVDWGPIIRVIKWEGLLLDHDSDRVAGRSEKSATPNCDNNTPALREVCHVVQNIIWTEHFNRLNQLGQFYGI